jgi:hypothetical protein
MSLSTRIVSVPFMCDSVTHATMLRTTVAPANNRLRRFVADGALRDAIVRKNAYAQKTGSDVYLVSQFGFVADPIISWETSTTPSINSPARATRSVSNA